MIWKGRHARGLWGWFVALCILTVLLAWAECYSNEPGKTLVWITIDTESTADWPIVEQFEAKADGIEFGIKGMTEIFDRFQVKATFFLNACEQKVCGEEAMQKIAQYIHSRGHDVQLHPHPDWAYDKNRLALWQYGLEEQVKIIGQGRESIKRWTGRYPIAFRAGGYMADNETLKALQYNKFLIDSSFIYGHPSCRISHDKLGVNRPAMIDQIWEIPVTVFERQEVPDNNFLGLKPVSRYRKIDIDWADLSDLELSITQAQENGLRIITLFLHSFSLKDLVVRRQDQAGKPALEDIKKLESILAFISRNPRLEVVTSAQILEFLRVTGKTLEKKDFLPQVMATISYPKYLKRRYLSGRDGTY